MAGRWGDKAGQEGSQWHFLLLMASFFSKGLVINYGEGGLQHGRGGAREVLPLRKGGGGKSFSHAEGGAQKVLG